MLPGGNYCFNKEAVNITEQIGAPILLDTISGKRRNGFFIDAGAVDGIHLSNTLFFELKRKFTGVLIEPSSSYKKMRLNNRKVNSLNVCFPRRSIPEVITFLDCDDIGGIEGGVLRWTKDYVNSPNTTRTKQICLPVHSILSALGNPKVNYFSLDIE